MQKVPYILVVGDKEKANGAVSVRARGNQDLGAMPLGDFAAKLADDIAQKGLKVPGPKRHSGLGRALFCYGPVAWGSMKGHSHRYFR